MDTTIRNLDPTAYRDLKVRAALEGRPVGDLVSEAIRAYVAVPPPSTARLSLRDWHPEPYPEGNERLSEDVDAVVYGVERP